MEVCTTHMFYTKNYEKMMLLRNHGLISRNINKIFGYNSRLDTIQACVANHMLPKIKKITHKRILNSKYLDKHLNKIDNIKMNKSTCNC